MNEKTIILNRRMIRLPDMDLLAKIGAVRFYAPQPESEVPMHHRNNLAIRFLELAGVETTSTTYHKLYMRRYRGGLRRKVA